MAERELAIQDLMEASGVGFGTSGARGPVAAMTDRVCYAYTVGFLQHLQAAGDLPPGGRVAVAGDLRASTPRIMRAVACAASDLGFVPVNAGFIPSPALALYGIERAIPAVMVTGSHIPDDRNGIKFNKPAGEILKSDESAIRARRVTLDDDRFAPDGSLAVARPLPPVDPDPFDRYVERYTTFFPPDCLAGMRVGVYEHSGVAREALGTVLRRLGAKVSLFGRSQAFVPVDTEAIRPEDVRLAHDRAARLGLDSIVSTDGDGDRPLVSDERGNWLRGDIAGILCARFLGVEQLVTPVSSNSAVEASGWFEGVARCRIGSPYVVAGMQRLLSKGARRVGGYEANGGFLTADALEVDGRTLPPLPTRDALVVILSILVLARRRGLGVSGLLGDLPPRFTFSDRLKAFPTEQGRALVERLGRGVAAGDFSAVEAFLGERFGEVASVDLTDGVRVTLANGEILHLRPSGNAPELRCYTEADTAERAGDLNRQCLALVTSTLPPGS